MEEPVLRSDSKPLTANSESITPAQAFWVWVKVALNSFGGPAGQIAVMHKMLVEEKRWIAEHRFLHALNFCMLLPGPEAQQLATYIGWLIHKTKGALIAGTLFILPGFISILLLSYLYAGYYNVAVVQALFFGLKPGVMAVVAFAAFRIGKRALGNNVMIGIALASFFAIFILKTPFPLIILLAGLLGFIGGRLWPSRFEMAKGHLSAEHHPLAETSLEQTERPTLARTLRILAMGLALWFGPLALIAAVFGPQSVFLATGVFFSQAAVVTFGGAYAVLAYIAQQSVEVFGWLLPHEMLDGLGMAETTPGPLIQVVQFVGFMAAFRDPGMMSPELAALLGSVIVTWVTYVPCFIWIFMGAPHIEHLRQNRDLGTTLSAITAAVVGVIINLALWFSLHNLFRLLKPATWGPITVEIPIWETLSLPFLVIGIGAFVALFVFRWGSLPTLAASTAAGMAYKLLETGFSP